MSQPIHCEINAGVATVTLTNLPLNLVTFELTEELSQTLDALAANDEVRVLVLTGAGGRAFSAGSDISEFPGLMGAGQVVPKKLSKENEAYSKVDDFPKPTIAAVCGLAYGGGLELAVCCDLIVAEDDARFCLPEIKLGVFPGSGGTVRVTRRIGEGRAKEMMFFGDPIDAATALAWGLINRSAPRGQGLRMAQEMAAVLAQRPGRALRLCKSAVELSFTLAKDEALSRTLALSDQAFSSADCREGVRAFMAKDTPRFSHS
jgi:enoyl-CoA hydratase/carnithine racemase